MIFTRAKGKTSIEYILISLNVKILANKYIKNLTYINSKRDTGYKIKLI